jgi:hypothetical protein
MDEQRQHERRLESPLSQAAQSPVANHDDVLSPSLALRESSASGGGQRLGDGVPVDGPITVFPDVDEDDRRLEAM